MSNLEMSEESFAFLCIGNYSKASLFFMPIRLVWKRSAKLNGPAEVVTHSHFKITFFFKSLRSLNASPPPLILGIPVFCRVPFFPQKSSYTDKSLICADAFFGFLSFTPFLADFGALVCPQTAFFVSCLV